ncbi:ParB N-terminal domain-containing protein [Criibacterium bergeronii]|uniref:ParB N-terminal domain-containing protein n=1 Tax=Criibacterium bergeronii TaxID=1871336 RepID=UPI001FA9C1DD|nr:ParB N-terminal domain-containing protein [Criibacterium bergeronii]
MNKNFPKRKIIVEDALDLFIEDKENAEIVELDINLLDSYHNHPFHLYEGKRLNDMVESIIENGILTPVIVQPKENDRYEILAGHNRVNAARQAQIDLIPCIVKENLQKNKSILM